MDSPKPGLDLERELTCSVCLHFSGVILRRDPWTIDFTDVARTDLHGAPLPASDTP